MMIEHLYWREPFFLGAALLPLLLFLVAWVRQRQKLHGVADAQLMPWVKAASSSHPQTFARWLFVIAWVLFSIALAGPRTPRLIPPELQPPGAAVVTIIDYSASMAARDGRPDRLGHAQQIFQDWLNSAPASLHMGIIIFSGHAHVLLKPSSDHRLLQHYAQQLIAIELPTLGNNLQQALSVAADILADEKGSQYIVVLTDGDLGEKAKQLAEVSLKQMATNGDIHIQLIGIGGPELVSIPVNITETLVVDDQQVVSRRDTRWLQQLAELADGRYQAVETLGDSSIAELLDLPEPRINPEDSQRILWDEWFALPLIAGIVLILFALSVRRKPLPSENLTLVILVMSCLLGSEKNAAADRSLSTYTVLFNEATSCYRTADYPCALQLFSEAAWQAPNDQLRGRAAFNLANSHFYLGDYWQAAVLFAEAGQLGVPVDLVQRNQSFADSLAAAVDRRLADIAETERRAEWRSAARALPEDMDDRLAEGIYLSQPDQRPLTLVGLSAEQLNLLIDQGIHRLHGAGGDRQLTYTSRSWIESPQHRNPENTAGLFKQLLPMEIGLPMTPEKPYRLQEQRPW